MSTRPLLWVRVYVLKNFLLQRLERCNICRWAFRISTTIFNRVTIQRNKIENNETIVLLYVFPRLTYTVSRFFANYRENYNENLKKKQKKNDSQQCTNCIGHVFRTCATRENKCRMSGRKVVHGRCGRRNARHSETNAFCPLRPESINGRNFLLPRQYYF